jgi:hypothetical protein
MVSDLGEDGRRGDVLDSGRVRVGVRTSSSIHLKYNSSQH